MRLTPLISTAFVLSLAGPAFAQGWIEYINCEEGFFVNFPSQPSVEQTIYTSEYGYPLPARIYSATRGQERYSMTVVDYTGIEKLGIERSANCPPGAEPCRGSQAQGTIGPGYWRQDVRGALVYASFRFIQRDAKVTHYMWNWTELVEGHQLQLTNPDQSRTFVLISMHQNKLYIQEGTVPAGYAEPALFQQSLSFVNREGDRIRYQSVYSNAYHGLGVHPTPARAAGGGSIAESTARCAAGSPR